MDLPFRAEYSKSNRAKCKGCKDTISQGVVRMATLTQSPFFDGKQANWYHFDCFFNKQRVKTVDDIEHFENLRIEDQDRIRKHVGSSSVIIPDAKGKKRGVDKDAAKAKKMALQDYLIENAKSGRAHCKGCEQKIVKDEVRVSKKDFESDIGKQVGGANQWYHVSCFAELRSELGYFEAADKLPGFKSLTKEEQADVLKSIPAIKQEDVPEVKKMKLEDDPLDKEYRQQNKIMFGYRDQLKLLNKNDLRTLLEHNEQEVPEGVENMLDRLCDIMTFGALKPCAECKDGQLSFNKTGYTCNGNLSEWAKCTYHTKDPERAKFSVPTELKKEYAFLKKYKYVPRKRVIKDVKPTVAVKKEEKDETDGPRIVREAPPLADMQFVILGQPKRGKDALKTQIVHLGGRVVTKISKSVMGVIADKEMVEKMGSRIQEAEDEQVHVISEDFIDKAKESAGKIPDLILKKSICNWGSDPTTRLPQPASSSKSLSTKSKSRFVSKAPSKIKLKLKGVIVEDQGRRLEEKQKRKRRIMDTIKVMKRR